MKRDNLTSVDVIVPLRNEAGKIPEFFAMLRAQTLQPDRVIVADGMSTDGSRELLAAAQAELPQLEIVDNVACIVPAALNVSLERVGSPLVARMDTHAVYEPTYLATVVEALEKRPNACGVGGAMETAGKGAWGQAIASTLRRPFGLGGARHRIGGPAGPITHVFSGCYRTESIRGVNGWDERFLANEDFEADTRLRKTACELWLIPEARSTWYVRESLATLAIQMWRYGFYKALTLRLHPDSLQLRQLAPPLLVSFLLCGSAVNLRGTFLVASAYSIAAGTLGALAAHSDGASPLRGAMVPPVVHFSWGAGVLVGIARFAFGDRQSHSGSLEGHHPPAATANVHRDAESARLLK